MAHSQTPEVAVLVSTYQRPRHLERCLLSIALQRGVAGRMEVVVADDGSTDETHELVRAFAATADFPVRMTTHPHASFQLARCRNEGVAAARAEYLIFLDGDCILPPDHVFQHLARRRDRVAYAGYCICLDRPTSERVTADAIRSGAFLRWGGWRERWKLAKLDWKSRFYYAMGHPMKPRLFGGNVGISRADYERVNGYDENFVGWGCEDDDMRIRLRRSGTRVASILRWTRTYHLWHPPTATAPMAWRAGSNVAYLTRPMRLTRCRNGLLKRSDDDLRLALLGNRTAMVELGGEWGDLVRFGDGASFRDPASMERSKADSASASHRSMEGAAEVELIVGDEPGEFSGRADCNILVLPDGCRAPPRGLHQAHVLVTNQSLGAPWQVKYRMTELRAALRNVA
ncbi:MAG: glycosyltransferase [Planctomycetes bacterium]|nr:glycosyltransferase [Planctomycetota bacterium]